MKDDAALLSRLKIWRPELDELLKQWKEQISLRKKGHTKIAIALKRRHYSIGIPSTILGTLMAAGILTTFRNCSDCENDIQSAKCATDEIIRLIIGFLGIIASCLAAAQTFLNYEVRSEQHKGAADSYESLYRIIDSLLLIPIEYRGDPIGTLQNIRSQYDDIGKSNPPLPEEYNIDLSYTTATIKGYKGDKPPKPNTDEDSPRHNRDIQVLQNILDEEEGDDEENVEVTLERQRSNAPAAIAANICAHEGLIQNSMINAMAFELKRMERSANKDTKDTKIRHRKKHSN